MPKSFKFVVLFIGLYSLFSWFTIFWIGVTSEGNLYWAFAAESLNFVDIFRRFLLFSAKEVCSLFGYETAFVGEFGLRVGNRGIRLVYSCLGFGVMSFYAAYVLAWPGFRRDKWLPLLSGLTFIVFLNIMRLALLPIIHIEYPSTRKFPIDHHDVFNIILYLAIAVMLISWTRKLNRDPK